MILKIKNAYFAKFRKSYKITLQLIKYALQFAKHEARIHSIILHMSELKVLEFKRDSFFVMFSKVVPAKISRFLSG